MLLTAYFSYPRTATLSRRLTTATESSSKPVPPPLPKSNDTAVSRIVDDISGLTLLQAADLVTLLKVREYLPRKTITECIAEISHD
jgi:large subunit ribosomal protein L7/L12